MTTAIQSHDNRIQDRNFNQTAKLGSQELNKALGANGNPALAKWYEDAYAYYNAVMSGQEPRPDNHKWQEFLNQMSWSYDQLMGASAWDPLSRLDSSPTNSNDVMENDPFGGQLGTNGNLVHTTEKSRIGFTGNERRDIWSNEIDIDIAPLSAQIQVHQVMDENIQPPEAVLKVIVSDPATGTTAVYVIHDYEDAKIKINVPNPSQVEDFSGIEPAIFEVGQFTPQNEINSSQQSSIPGKAHPEHENYLIYEGRHGQSIEFYPESNPDGINMEYHEVYGDSMIMTRPSDQVNVLPGINEMGFSQEDGYTVVVTHRDGNQDIYYIHKGYDVALGAKPEYISWNGATGNAEGTIPGEYSQHVSIISGELDSQSSASHPEDSAPDRPIENDTAYYNSQNAVSLHNDYASKIKNHDITTAGTVEIYAENYEDSATVIAKLDGSYQVIMQNKGGEAITYTVKGPPSQIHLTGFLPSKVKISREIHPGQFIFIYDFQNGADDMANPEDLDVVARIRVNSDEARDPLEEIDTLAESPTNNTLILSNLMEASGANEAQVMNALQSAGITQWDSFEELQTAINSKQGDFPLDLSKIENIEKITRFLYNLDGTISQNIQGANAWDRNVLAPNYQRAAERIVALLKALYPNENISTNLPEARPDTWWRNNEIVINGTIYNFTQQTRGKTNIFGISETTQNEAHPG